MGCLAPSPDAGSHLRRALYFSEFSQVGAHARARYVLTAYIPLFLFLGGAIATLARRSRAASAVVLVFVLAFNLWTNLAFMWPLRPQERRAARAVIARRETSSAISTPTRPGRSSPTIRTKASSCSSSATARSCRP